MKNNQSAKTKGRFSWIITLLEVVIMIAFLVIGFGGIAHAFANMSFVGMFRSVETAIWFLVIATVVTTIMCFLPPFKSEGNMRIAIWNMIWLVFTVYSLIN